MAQSKRKVNHTSFDDTGSSDETTSNKPWPAYNPGHRHKKQKNNLSTPQTPQETSTANKTRSARPQTTSSSGMTAVSPAVEQSAGNTHTTTFAQSGNNADDAIIISDVEDDVSTFESSNSPLAINTSIDRTRSATQTSAIVAPGGRPSALPQPSAASAAPQASHAPKPSIVGKPATVGSLSRWLLPPSNSTLSDRCIVPNIAGPGVRPRDNLTCYELAHTCPNSLHGADLDALIQRGFTAPEILIFLSEQALQVYRSHPGRNKAQPIATQLGKREQELRDAGAYDMLMKEMIWLRDDGRYPEICTKWPCRGWVTGEIEIPKPPPGFTTCVELPAAVSKTSLPSSSPCAPAPSTTTSIGKPQLPMSQVADATLMIEGTEVSPSTPTASKKGKGRARADSFDGNDDWDTKVVNGGPDESEWNEDLVRITASTSLVADGSLKGWPVTGQKRGIARRVDKHNTVKPRATTQKQPPTTTKKTPATNEEPRVTKDVPVAPTEDTSLIIDDASATDDEAPMIVNEASDFEDDTLDPEYKVPITSNILSDDEDETPITTKRPRFTTQAPVTTRIPPPTTQTPVNASEPLLQPSRAGSEELNNSTPLPEVVDASVHRQVLVELEQCKQDLASMWKARQACERDLMTERKERVGDQSEVRKLNGVIRELKTRLGI